MRTWLLAVVVVLLATFATSAQYRYFVSGAVQYGSCGTLRVEMGPEFNFTKQANNGSGTTLISQMTSFPVELSGNNQANWFLVGDQSCCMQQPTNCSATGWTRLQAMGPNCWQLTISAGAWQVIMFFTRMQQPVVSTEQCDFTRVSAPEAQCGGFASVAWYVTDNPNPSGESDWKFLGWTGSSINVTPDAVAASGIGDPYGPLFVSYRYGGADIDIGFSDFSGKVPISLFHAAPRMTLVPLHQLCKTPSGVTLTNTVVMLPRVRLSIRRNFGNGVYQNVLPDTEYNRESLENLFFPLDPGTYEMAVRNQGGSNASDACEAIFSFVISTANPAVEINAVSGHETCFGPANTGSITLTPGGANTTPPYTYAWAHDANLHDKDLTGLAGDKTYSVTVRDKNGCVGTKDIWVDEPSQIRVTDAYVSSRHNGAHISCPSNAVGVQNDGTIHLDAEGGTGKLRYRLVGEAHNAGFQTSEDFTDLYADVYAVYVKDSLGCEIGHTATVSVVAPADIRHSRMTVVPLRCNGLAEGTITIVNARGGTGALVYGIAGANYQQSNVIENRSGQTYTVSIRDANGCRRDTAVVVEQPPAIQFDSIRLVPQSCTAVVDGVLKAFASGGTGAIEYALADTDREYKTSGVFSSLPSATYTVYARDANKCVVPSGGRLLPMKPAINATISIKDSISCHGQQDGALRLTIVNGGTAPYAIQWADQRGTTEEIAGLGAATYSVTVTDAKTCQQRWMFPLGEPGELTPRPQVSDYEGFGVRCTGSADGTIHLKMEGGTAPYQYAWTDGPRTRDRTALPKGTYAVSVVDYHGCRASADNIEITEPLPLTLRLAEQKNISCYGFTNGRITLEASGGAGIYEYSRDQATWQPESVFTGLPAGNYTLHVRDGNACTTDAVKASLLQPYALELTQLDKRETTCGQANGMLLIELRGGTRDYAYAWYNESGNVVSTTDKAEQLAFGDYRFVGTDANACTVEEQYTINNSDGPQVKQVLSRRLTCHDSNDGAIGVTVSGGLAPYTISWDIPGEQGLSVTNVTGGDHWIKVLDSRGCQNKTDFLVEYPEAIRVTPTLVLPRCYGNSDGSIEIAVDGGNPGGYTYTWAGTSETGPRRTGLTAGNYRLTVKDTKDCTLEQEIVLNNPALYTVDAGGDRTICVGQQLSLAVPDDAIVCQWTSDAGYSSAARNVVLTIPAHYTLQVTNANGCIAEDYFTIATSDDLLAADFLMAARAVAGDTVVLVDISWPVPDNIGWSFPAGTQIVSTDNIYAAVIFPEAGDYEVILDTHLGECIDNLAKRITIVGGSAGTNGREAVTGLTQFDVYPNPNDGAFAVRVAFVTPAAGHFSVVDLSGSRTFVRESFAGQLSYEFRPTVLYNLPSGIYVFVLESGGERYYKRIVKK